MYKLLFWVFSLNLILKFFIQISTISSYNFWLELLRRCCLVFFIIYFWYKMEKNKFHSKIFKSVKWLFFSFTLLLASFLVIVKETDLINTKKNIWLIFECLSVGILEELLFRYIVFDYLLNTSKKFKKSILLTSFLFAIFHVSNLFFGSSLYSTIIQIEFAFLLGLLLQLIFIKTKNLIIVNSIHAVINFFGSQSSLTTNQTIEKVSFNDFVLNQILILLIYLIILPLYFWKVKNDKFNIN